MTEKRFIIMNNIPKGTHTNIWDKQKQHNQGIGDELWLGEVVAMLNEGVILAEENEQLKTQLQNTSSQRDEFHRGARENANRIGKLEKENEQLKSDNFNLNKSVEYLDEIVKEQCIKLDWASECGVKWDKEFKNWKGYE